MHDPLGVRPIQAREHHEPGPLPTLRTGKPLTSWLDFSHHQPFGNRGRKRHINIWHINNSSVTSVTDPPYPNPPGRAPGQKCLCSLGSAHTRSGDPPPTRAVTGKICLCLCAFSFPEEREGVTSPGLERGPACGFLEPSRAGTPRLC